jgi:hypothetical protein
MIHPDSVHFGAVTLAAVVSFMLGGLWFSPLLFGHSWMQEVKLTPDQLARQKARGMARTYVSAFICALVTAFVMALFIEATGARTAASGALMGILAALGFVATSIETNFLFEDKSTRLFLITAGHHLLTFAASGAILGAMH